MRNGRKRQKMEENASRCLTASEPEKAVGKRYRQERRTLWQG